MQTSDKPSLIPVPFANSGTKNTIPTDASPTPGLASLETGFPPITMTPVAAGGIPPQGADFNGIFNLISAASRWAQAGGSYTFDADFAASIGGYPKGAVLLSADGSGFWMSTADNNTADPDSGGAGWVAANGQQTGIIGTTSSARMSITSNSTTATFTADEIVVGTALGGRTYRIANFSQVINISTTGAGGMDTGSAPASGYVALYAIYNPLTGARALLATDATSAVAPVVYSGSSLPAGYTASALVSVWPTNASGQFVIGMQRGRAFQVVPVTVLSTTSNAVLLTALNIATAVPPNAIEVSGYNEFTPTSTTTAGYRWTLAGSSNNIGAQLNESLIPPSTSNIAIQCNFSGVQILTPQTLYYAITTSGNPTGTGVIRISGYRI